MTALAVPLACALAYALGVRRAPRGPTLRALAWAAGVLAVSAALCPPMHVWADARLSGHMVQHGLLAMVASFVVANWNLFAPRYLHPELPGFALFLVLGLRRFLPGPRLLGGAAVVVTLALLALWLHLSSVTPASL